MTDSSHAGADLRISNPRTSAQFIEMLNDCGAPLPWTVNDIRQIIAADGGLVCDVNGTNGAAIAALIVVAVNTCVSSDARKRYAELTRG